MDAQNAQAAEILAAKFKHEKFHSHKPGIAKVLRPFTLAQLAEGPRSPREIVDAARKAELMGYSSWAPSDFQHTFKTLVKEGAIVGTGGRHRRRYELARPVEGVGA